MKRALKIIGWILFFPLVFVIAFFLPISDEFMVSAIVVLWIGVPLVAVIIWLRKPYEPDKEEEARLDTVIPGKVGKRSRINEKTGEILLLSSDFHTYRGISWKVNRKSVSIRSNDDSTVKTTPISKIKNVEFDTKLRRLTFSVPDTSYNPLFPTSGETRETIYFRRSDLHIARAVHERLSGE